MFFLLRMAFWLGLVLVLLPTDKTPDADKAPHVGAVDAISAASAAVSDMSQFCSRQPAACNVGGQAASVIGARAQSGAKKVYEFITDKADKKSPEVTDKPGKKAPDHTGSIDPRESGAAGEVAAAQQTLTEDDLRIEWREPAGTVAAAP